MLAGTWLAEFSGDSRYGHVVRYINDILLSAPSIIIGIFIWGVLVAPFHTYSGLAGSVALAMIAIPIITRATEDVLRLQPTALREASSRRVPLVFTHHTLYENYVHYLPVEGDSLAEFAADVATIVAPRAVEFSTLATLAIQPRPLSDIKVIIK